MKTARLIPTRLCVLTLVLFLAACSGKQKDEVEKLGGRIDRSDDGVSITLTGWQGKGKDYELVKKYDKVVRLQMANKDVTDEVLGVVGGLDQLRELDLDDTQVTDKGLEALKGLKKLETLRLENTKVTDGAFDVFAGLDNLTRLELSGTAVTRPPADRWKKAKSGRRYSL